MCIRDRLLHAGLVMFIIVTLYRPLNATKRWGVFVINKQFGDKLPVISDVVVEQAPQSPLFCPSDLRFISIISLQITVRRLYIYFVLTKAKQYFVLVLFYFFSTVSVVRVFPKRCAAETPQAASKFQSEKFNMELL